MTWQDLVISGGSIMLALALLPSLFSVHKPARSTALLTCLVLLAFSITYATLGLTLATIVSFIAAIEWLILYLQRARASWGFRSSKAVVSRVIDSGCSTDEPSSCRCSTGTESACHCSDRPSTHATLSV